MVKRRINIEKISKKENRLVCFSKRRSGLFKKAHVLSALTGAQIAVLVLSESGRPYFHSSSPSFVDQFITPEFSLAASTSSSPASAESSSGGGANEDWLRYLLDFGVEEVDVEDLVAVKEKLEEMRERAAMALDWSFANSLLLSGDFNHDSLPPNDNVDDSSVLPS
ncbi:MADS-box transcription factor [Parasponia andersonii]|uniref:MADS-box transcription factor n=1 Tax=Parasponia andersonii TaxID=3476 RepID=A0A2P5DLH9_PARAD|nr:MADS-box transcription factor [Parasponia andersonii]